MIPKETINRIYDAVDIIEVVEDFVQLKKAGQNYKGLSPWHEEKTPSFVVSPVKQIFKDFSSGKGGDSVKFLMELEGMSYVEALKYLAQKYNIEIEEREMTNEQKQAQTERDSLFIALNFAKNFYHDKLLNDEQGRSVGLSYFKERGFNDNTIEAFELGYSLDAWDGLLKEAKKKQYNLDILDKAGLIKRKEDGKEFDYFRGRVIFPIHSVSGKPIAFGARILTNDKKQPKYLNSPETDVYHKSHIVYGIYQAKGEIRNTDNCYLVEGYTDVISLYQAGIKNVVASSGTALTKEQIKLIGRFTKNITVLYDGDNAGIKASLRGIDIILEEGLNVSAVTFPEGEDPDSYCKALGGEKFGEYLRERKTDFITFKTQLYLEEIGRDPIKKAEVIKDIVGSIAKIPDKIKQSVFFKECSKLLDIGEDVLISEHNKGVLKEKHGREKRDKYEKQVLDQAQEVLAVPIEVETQKSTDPHRTLDEQELELLRILISYGTTKIDEETILAKYIIEETGDFEFLNPVHAKIFKLVTDQVDSGDYQPQNLVREQDDEVSSAVVDMLTDRYEISKNWEERHSVYVNSEKDNLGEIVYKSVLRLKWRSIRVMLAENTEKMKKAQSDQEIEDCLKINIKLKNTEMKIAKILGNVTI